MKIFLALGLLVSLSTSARAAVSSDDWSDSGVHGPNYAQIQRDMDKLAADYKDLVSVLSYGNSPEGRPLKMMLVMRKNRRFAEHPTLVMSGTTHGNEYLNIEDRLPRELLAKSRKTGNVARFLNEGGAFVFIPILNPDGYENHTRENVHGVDLNRDWTVKAAEFKGFHEAETKLLANKLEAMRGAPYNLQYRITVDYHCCIGALLQPWGFTKNHIPTNDDLRHNEVSSMARKLLDIEGGTTGDILGYFPVGTTKDYYYERYGALSFTYEGRHRIERDYFPKHVQWWEEMAGYVLKRATRTAFSMKMERRRNPFRYLAEPSLAD